MSNLALKHPARIKMPRRHEAPQLVYGAVEGLENDHFLVNSSGGQVKALRAVSCLLDPQEKDTVLFAKGADANWILAVLERPGDKDATLSFEGTVKVRVPEGGIHMSAAEAISMSSETMTVSAENASAVFGSVNLVTRVYKSCIDNAVSVVERLHLFCGHMRQHLVRSYKRVDGQEVEHAARRLMQAESMDIVARKTEIRSGERVSVNASQFHVN
jgi:Protein of unknown function (DUF3540).